MRNDKGQFASPANRTLNTHSDLHETFCREYRQRKSPSEATFDTRQRESRYWLAWCEAEGVDPRAATTEDIKRYVKGLRTKKAATTVGSYYQSVRVFYRELLESTTVDVLAIDENPAEGVNLRREYDINVNVPEYAKIHETDRESDIIAIEPTTVRNLFDHVPGEKPDTRLRNEVLLKLCWYTACRADELCRMEVKKIDHDDCTIEVRSSKLNRQDHPDLYIREVCYPEAFDYQLRRWKRKRGVYSKYADTSPYLLLTQHSEQMQPSTVTDIVKTAAENAGVQEPLRPANPRRIPEDVNEWLITPHRIRRAAISHWVNNCNRIDLHQARRMAGHAQIERTIEYLEPDYEQLIADYQASFEG